MKAGKRVRQAGFLLLLVLISSWAGAEETQKTETAAGESAGYIDLGGGLAEESGEGIRLTEDETEEIKRYVREVKKNIEGVQGAVQSRNVLHGTKNIRSQVRAAQTAKAAKSFQ